LPSSPPSISSFLDAPLTPPAFVAELSSLVLLSLSHAAPVAPVALAAFSLGLLEVL